MSCLGVRRVWTDYPDILVTQLDDAQFRLGLRLVRVLVGLLRVLRRFQGEGRGVLMDPIDLLLMGVDARKRWSVDDLHAVMDTPGSERTRVGALLQSFALRERLVVDE